MYNKTYIKDKIVRVLIDALLDPLLRWIIKELDDDITITLDTLKEKALEIFHEQTENNPEQVEIVFDYADAFMNGITQGERRKETAIIEGMKNAGMSPMQIQFIMLQAQESLVRMGTDDLEIPQPTKKVAKKRKRSR